MNINLKTEKEIQIMREGGEILARILKEISETAKPGITTSDLDKLARELILFYKVQSSFLNYDGYPAVLCTSINDEIVHSTPSDRILKKGDVLKLDMGVFHKGFHTDSAVTILINDTNSTSDNNHILKLKQKLINVTEEALNIGISKARSGNALGDIGLAIQKYVENNGFNVVRDLVGHGIGKQLHEPPQVLNYGEAGKGDKLKKGMVIAIEPMVVTGSWGIKKGNDGFGYITEDGGLAAHFEHTVAITDKGPFVLTRG
jgi:methionyl aminopeptidase